MADEPPSDDGPDGTDYEPVFAPPDGDSDSVGRDESDGSADDRSVDPDATAGIDAAFEPIADGAGETEGPADEADGTDESAGAPGESDHPGDGAATDDLFGDDSPSEDAPTEFDTGYDLAANERYCSNCGFVIAADADLCPECGVRQEETEGTEGKDPDPTVSAILSFLIPGAGQFYNGQVERGIVVFGLWVLWWLALGAGWFVFSVLTFGIGILAVVFLPVVDVVFHGIAAADAHSQAKQIARGDVVP